MNLSIPLDKSPRSYSGLGTAWQNFSQSQAPKLNTWLDNYEGNVNKAYDAAGAGLGSIAQQQLNPAIQATINQLAGRNMLNSSVAADTLRGSIGDVSNQILGYGANLNANRAGSLLDYGKQLMAGGAMGQYSESTNELAPYQMMAQLIMADL